MNKESQELSKINETLRQIERKIKDDSPFSVSKLLDWTEMEEKRRNEEMLKIQKDKNEMLNQQLKILKNQNLHNGIIIIATMVLAFGTTAQVLLNYTSSLYIFYGAILGLLFLSITAIIISILSIYNTYKK